MSNTTETQNKLTKCFTKQAHDTAVSIMSEQFNWFLWNLP